MKLEESLPKRWEDAGVAAVSNGDPDPMHQRSVGSLLHPRIIPAFLAAAKTSASTPDASALGIAAAKAVASPGQQSMAQQCLEPNLIPS